MTWQVHLEIFDGPLDLLLYLIEREEIDIYDIPIARVVGQYLDYIKDVQSLDIDRAGEFLVMAATLCGIKARMLLPSQPAQIEEEGDLAGTVDPRQELVARLLEYSRYREAGRGLSQLEVNRGLTYRRWEEAQPEAPDRPLRAGEVTPEDLFQAFLRILERRREPHPREIAAEVVTVKEKISQLMRLIAIRSGPVRFTDLFEVAASRLEVVVTFLAVLELNRQRLITIIQPDPLGDISIRRREAVTHDV